MRQKSPAVLLLLIFILHYLLSMPGEPLTPDGYELSLAARDFGVAHPPGYGIYLYLFGGFAQVMLWFGVSAQSSLNILNLVFGILACIPFLLLFRFRILPLVFSLCLFLGAKPAQQAFLSLEVYSFQIFCFNWILWIALQHKSRGWQGIFLLLCGILAIHHTSTLVILALMILWKARQWVSQSYKVYGLLLIGPAVHFSYLMMFGADPNRLNLWSKIQSPVDALTFTQAGDYAGLYLKFPDFSWLSKYFVILSDLIPFPTLGLSLIALLLCAQKSAPVLPTGDDRIRQSEPAKPSESSSCTKDLPVGGELHQSPLSPSQIQGLIILCLIWLIQCSFYRIGDIDSYMLIPISCMALLVGQVISRYPINSDASRGRTLGLVAGGLIGVYLLSGVHLPARQELDTSMDSVAEALAIQESQANRNSQVYLIGRDLVHPALYRFRKDGLRGIPYPALINPQAYAWLREQHSNLNLLQFPQGLSQDEHLRVLVSNILEKNPGALFLIPKLDLKLSSLARLEIQNYGFVGKLGLKQEETPVEYTTFLKPNEQGHLYEPEFLSANDPVFFGIRFKANKREALTGVKLEIEIFERETNALQARISDQSNQPSRAIQLPELKPGGYLIHLRQSERNLASRILKLKP